MPVRRPPSLSATELRARRLRVAAIARRMGFVGRIEYQHAYSRSGGAQYGLAVTPERDLLTVFAEAFERNADPEEFSLEAIIAHERGHQLVARHPRLLRIVPAMMSGATEEILASLVGSLVVDTEKDRQDLLLKAWEQASRLAMPAEQALASLTHLREMLGRFL